MEQSQEQYGLLQRIYLRCMAWIQTPAGVWVLFFIAVAESSFFPIPPDVFLIALCIGAPKKSFKYAALCSLGSVLGGALGYALGWGFMDTLGTPILEMYHLQEKYVVVQDAFRRYDAWAVGMAAFTPIPYKLFTITAGAFKTNFVTFMVVSLVARSARFCLVAGLIYFFGAKVQYFINKYFNILTVVFMVLLIGGFVLLKYLL
ncbi:YqaA family protein [Desulfogranum japonicum]|uniref:YqaA family protein n=1 Tax=Desulfogranum japonicum TaxID=231447 RepID=UPI00041739C9|nr:VTT domain-containing protein [Desulfogranum japonicum]